MKIFLTLILLLSGQLVFSQQSVYNVYEIGKGEILKNNYFYLDCFNDDLLIACPLIDSVDYDYADLVGVINLKEDIILPFQYRNLEKVRDDFKKYKGENPMLAVSNGKGRALFRLTNGTFEQITDFEYLKFRPYLFSGLYLNGYDGYCQIIDLKTGSVFKTKFLETFPLTSNLISTKNWDYKWGVINIKGDTILANQYDRIDKITEMLVSFKKQDSIGVINNNGELVLPPIFSRINSTKNRILAQTFDHGDRIEIDEILLQRLSNWTAIVQKDGKPQSVIHSINHKNIQQIGLFGAFDFNGVLVIPFEYMLLQQGLGNEIIANRDGKFGVILDDGKTVIDFDYDEITPLLDTYYLVRNKSDFGLFTTNNKKILEVKFKKIFPISNKEVLCTDNDFWYKISYSNKFEKSSVQQTKWNASYSLSYMKTLSREGYGYQSNTDFFAITDSRNYGIINKSLNLIVPIINNKEPGYFNEKYFNLGRMYTSKGVDLLDLDLSRNYMDDNLEFRATIIGKKGDKYGVVNNEGETVIPFNNSYIQNIDGKKFIVKK